MYPAHLIFLLHTLLTFTSWSEADDSALIEAVKKGDAAAAQILLTQGSNVEAKGQEGQTALILATDKGDVVMVHTLLAKGANVDSRDSSGRTPLMTAVGRADISHRPGPAGCGRSDGDSRR